VIERIRAKERVAGGGNYFTAPKTDIEFISSGSKLLDLALGGGWAEERIINIVGDKSTGKTLLAIEAAANFARKYKQGRILYREAESAFLPDYAGALGMPLDRVEFGNPNQPIETVEDLFEDLDKVLSKPTDHPILYILDSLDALSDREELDRPIDKGTYGTAKARYMSQIFRRTTSQMAEARCTLIIISQVRDNIGVMIGKKTTRSGGRALDFYASQVAYLQQITKLVRTISKIERVTGVKIRAKIDKNKIGLPFREAEFNISFGYGIDDVPACLEWLRAANALSRVTDEAKVETYLQSLRRMPDSEYYQSVRAIHKATEQRWYEVENAFLPKRKKYNA
jgi:recombination protein RecA